MARYFEERAAPAVWLGSYYRNDVGLQCCWSGTEAVPCMLAAVTRAACTTSGAPLEGPRCPEISRQAQYLRTFDIYCLSEQTTTRTAVVHVQVDQAERETGRIYVLSRFQKKRRTHTDTHTRTHRHAHPTHIILHRWDTFWVSRLDPHTTTACAHSRFRSTCCSRLDCNSTRRGAVLLCAPSCVLCDTFNKSHRRWAVLSDTSSRPVTDDALVYRCLVSSSLFPPLPPKRNVASALHLAFSLTQTDPARGVFAPRCR